MQNDIRFIITGLFFFLFGMLMFFIIPNPDVSVGIGMTFAIVGLVLFVIGFFNKQNWHQR